MRKVVSTLVVLVVLLLSGCRGGAIPGFNNSSSGVGCPLRELPYPRPEPDYSGKQARDLSPFNAELAAYTPEQAAARTVLVQAKTIPELQDLMQSGELSAEELVIYYLERIQRYDIDKLNAVLEINPDVLQIARDLDAERAAGSLRGPLHGIPVLLKDNIATGDRLHTAAGAAAMLGWDPERDAFLVAQLRQAGAIILGKANLSEWANYMDACMPNGFSANGGQTQNPYGPYETYGSSSGSAVAVAADLTTVSVGTETQGSIIAPATVNSVVGLKTSLGLVSRDYVIPLLPWQDTPGPMGRTVTDVAVLLGAMNGEDANDPETSRAAALTGTDFTQYLTPDTWQNVRVGIPVWDEAAYQAFFERLNITDEQIQEQMRANQEPENRSIRATGDVLKAAGVEVVEISQSDMQFNAKLDVGPALEYGYKEAINAFLADLGPAAPVGSLEAIIAFNDEDPANRAPYGQDLLEASQNTRITAEEYARLQQGNPATARQVLDELFSQHQIDLILSDVGQIYAPAGYPALSVPSGYDEDGEPQSIVLVGPSLSEPQLLAVGYAYEQATRARVNPDLEATLQLIAALSGSD